MLSLSQTTGYAIRALSCLEGTSQDLVLVRDIAEQAGVPKPYLSKILHSLGQAGLIVSKRGYRGGVALARPASEITLLEVAEAVDGHRWVPRCLLGLTECSDDRRCALHEFWVVERGRIEEELRRTTLAQIAETHRRQALQRSQNETLFPMREEATQPLHVVGRPYDD